MRKIAATAAAAMVLYQGAQGALPLGAQTDGGARALIPVSEMPQAPAADESGAVEAPPTDAAVEPPTDAPALVPTEDVDHTPQPAPAPTPDPAPAPAPPTEPVPEAVPLKTQAELAQEAPVDPDVPETPSGEEPGTTPDEPETFEHRFDNGTPRREHPPAPPATTIQPGVAGGPGELPRTGADLVALGSVGFTLVALGLGVRPAPAGAPRRRRPRLAR